MRVNVINSCAALVALCWMSAGAVAADTLHVAAAANLQKVMTEALIPAFKKQTGTDVTPSFGATKQLALQLSQGAPLDVFVSADTFTVDKLAAQGLVLPTSERVYAIGQLVMWTRKDAKLHPKRIQDLASPAYQKIAIANPATAPYGLAAQQSFTKAGLTAILAPRIAQAENIGQSLQYAQSGNADVSLTALSLVIEDKTDPYVIVPASLHAPIAQSVAIVKGTTHPLMAQRFLDFLTSPSTASIWKQYGYSLPKTAKK